VIRRGFIFLILPVSAYAQILNVEKIRLEYPEDKVVFGNIGTNLSYSNRSANLQTPVRVATGGLTSDIGYFSDNHLFMLINNYQLLFVNDARLVNFGYTHFRTQFFQKNPLSFEVFTQYQYDQARGLQTRLLGGAGPRWRLLKTDAWNIAVGTGLMYEGEDWRDPLVATAQTINARYLKSTNYLAFRYAINENVDANMVVYYQVGYDRDYDQTLHRVSSDLNLSVKLVEKLSLTVAVNAAWESHPIVPIIPFIFAITNGVKYKF
jgi:hypothetical protein